MDKNLTEMALNTKGKPDILLLAMLKWVSLLPTVAMKSERQVLETALRELHDEGCKNCKIVINLFSLYFFNQKNLLSFDGDQSWVEVHV